MIDHTHDMALQSWVESANEPGTDFPIQNLPFGRFRRAGTGEPLRIGVAIGSQVLDLRLALQQCPWADSVMPVLQPLADGDLYTFMKLGLDARRTARAALSAALAEDSLQGPFLDLCLVPRDQAEMALPCPIGDYTDFYTGVHHAAAVGKLFRPHNPLLPNYKWLPLAYHGRSSTIVVSGQGVRRPSGQFKGDSEVPVFEPCRRLDYELEIGAIVGTANTWQTPVPISQAEEHLFGLMLLNDWSARDLQAWEYPPLGPFLSKSFATTVSPWLVTMEALEPFRMPFVRDKDDPQPLPYLDSANNRERGAIAITLEVWLQSAAMRERRLAPRRMCQANFADAYWTLAQMLAHHTSNGCQLRAGDLLGSGTQSGSKPDQGGSLLELTRGGQQELVLPDQEPRTFLKDGDTVILRGFCEAPGALRIGFGECIGTVLPAYQQ